MLRLPAPARFTLLAVIVAVGAAAVGDVARAQSPQFKIEADGTVLMLKRVNVTSFVYVPHAKAELRTDAAGKAIWYFVAPTGKVYTAPAPDQPPAPQRLTESELAAAFAAATRNGQMPAELKVELGRQGTLFAVKFVKNTLDLRWHAQVGLTAQEYEVVNRTLRGQGYVPLFAEVYTDSQRQTRFVAAWRQ